MIEAIYITSTGGADLQQVDSADLIAGQGIVGDRHYGRSDWRGQNVTFVEREEIERYNAAYGQKVSVSATRRNIITRGVRLNELVGKTFRVGQVRFLGVRLCEPCSVLGSRLENASIAKQDVVRAFTHRCGLRADVLNDGRIAAGMRIEPEGPA